MKELVFAVAVPILCSLAFAVGQDLREQRILPITAVSTAQDFKQYPGAKLDEQASRQASAAAKGLECQVYTTDDSFVRVYTFYKSLYQEFPTPFPVQKLPNGQEVKWAFFILDGEKDLSHSKHWMKIQRPYIGTIAEVDPEDFKDIRNVNVIQTIRKR